VGRRARQAVDLRRSARPVLARRLRLAHLPGLLGAAAHALLEAEFTRRDQAWLAHVRDVLRRAGAGLLLGAALATLLAAGVAASVARSLRVGWAEAAGARVARHAPPCRLMTTRSQKSGRWRT
jgi:hypothetical protein